MHPEPATHPPQTQHEFVQRLKAATPHSVVMSGLIAINIGVFLVMMALGYEVLGGPVFAYLRFGANFAPLTTAGEWSRLVTSLFVHFGILHLAINMWMLWDSGKLAEHLFGNTWFAVIYLFAGVCGGCASMLWNQQAISAGASGAIFGVLGSLLAYQTVQRGAVPQHVMNRVRVSSSIFVTYSLFYGFALGGIDNAAHAGGLAAGYAMGLIMARPLAAPLRHAHNARRAVLAAVLAGITLPAAVMLTPEGDRLFRQAVAVQRASDAYNADEDRLSRAFQRMVDELRSGKMSDATALKELRTTLLPQWDGAVARLAAVELDAQAPARKDYDLLMRYAVARRDMISAVADYLEASTPAHEKRVADLRVQAAEALERYQQHAKK